MEPIKITQKLSATPSSIEFRKCDLSTLSLEASGPGEVEIQYSISEEKSIRFLEGVDPKRILIDTVVLESPPIAIEKRVRFCLINEENLKDTFMITAVIRKKVPEGSPAISSSTRKLCTYWASNGTMT